MRFDNHNLPVYATVHGAAIMRSSSQVSELIAYCDWERLGKYIRGEWPRELPKINKWNVDTLSTTWDYLRDGDTIIVDTEYDPETQLIYQIGVYNGSSLTIWDRYSSDFDDEDIYDDIRDLIHGLQVVYQNAIADLTALNRTFGITYGDHKHIDDLLYIHSLLYPEFPHNLKFISSIYSDYNSVKGQGPGSYEYLRGDLLDTYCSFKALWEELEANPGLMHIYQENMLPLLRVLEDTEYMRVNMGLVDKYHEDLTKYVDYSSKLAKAYIGRDINLASTPQVAGSLELNNPKTTKKGNISLDRDEVSRLRDMYVPRDYDEQWSVEYINDRIERGAHVLLESKAMYMWANKLLSTYIGPHVEGEEYVRPEFLPWAQVTGRWSSKNPNINNIPTSISDIFLPRPGRVWISFDWDAIEARIMAAISGDRLLLKAFENGEDIHTQNVCLIFGYELPHDLVNPHGCKEWVAKYKWEGKEDIRRVFAKSFFYGLCYGLDPKNAASLPKADMLGVSKEEIVEGANAWLREHDSIAAFRRRIENQVRTTMTVTCPFGRTRQLLDKKYHSRVKQAYDYPMQAAAAYIMNDTILKLHKLTKDEGGKLVFPLHDSIKWAMYEDRYLDYLEPIKEIVTASRVIEGVEVDFPATFKVITDEKAI